MASVQVLLNHCLKDKCVHACEQHLSASLTRYLTLNKKKLRHHQLCSDTNDPFFQNEMNDKNYRDKDGVNFVGQVMQLNYAWLHAQHTAFLFVSVAINAIHLCGPIL